MLISVWNILVLIFSSMVQTMLGLILLFSMCSYMGWVHRFIWWFIETKLSEAWNDATVTIGSFEFQWFPGHIIVYNAVIHTPRQEEWNWSSPIIARVGKVELEWNMSDVLYQLIRFTIQNPASTLFTICFPRHSKFVIKPPTVDCYTVQISDVQVFVERRQQILNVYLLDPSLILPDPKTIALQPGGEETGNIETIGSDGTSTTTNTISTHEELEAEQQAQELMTQLLEAMGNTKKKDAWKEVITQKLRELQGQKTTVSLQEGVKVITKMGQAVAKSTQVMMPIRRDETIINEDEVIYCRIGRVRLRHIRIFTRGSGTWKSSGAISQLLVRASELCPPMSSFEDGSLPALYQPLDKLVDVVFKRVLTELAKSRQLLDTAMGELLGFAVQTTNKNNPAEQQPQPPSSPLVASTSL
mmetsp:Transcript_11415/g.16753  ORF Transcript_11415/g.16753 Transcript_11415/m.16753 type:complete len:414 (+) Transcript_11415:220-1461(+)